MKLKALLLGLCGLGLGFTSCNLNDDPDNNYFTGTYTCCNLVIPSDGESFAMNATYDLAFYYTTGQVNVATSNLNLGYGTFSFSSTLMPSVTKYYSVDWSNSPLDVTTFSGGSANDNGVVVQNLKGYTSSIVNVLSTNDPVNPAYKFTPYIPLVMSYTVNHDYTVKTFMPDAIYRGETVIRTVSTGNTFTNSGVRYRVYFSQDLKKADIIFYNAKFAEAMPLTINFVLKNLDVTYNKSGYIISNSNGEPVNPWMYESDGLTENPAYQFTSFQFINSSSDLSVGNCYYTVQIGNAQYRGEFSGYYVLSGQTEN